MKCRRAFVLFILLTVLTRGDDVTTACDDQEDAVTIATRHATAIFTGKVDSLSTSTNGDVTAIIIVKRVLKKNSNEGVFEFLNKGEQVRVRIVKNKPSSLKVEKYRTSKFIEATIDLQQLADNLNCSINVMDGYSIVPGLNFVKKLRVRDTKIFLVRKVETRNKRLLFSSKQEPSMELDAPPLALKLNLLDKVSSAIKDMTYKPRSPIIEELCEKTYCAYGANCVQTADGRAECQCPSDCPSTFTPVCGTDGVTYSNHCVMRLKSCRQEKNTRVQHAGECDPRSPKRRHRG